MSLNASGISSITSERESEDIDDNQQYTSSEGFDITAEQSLDYDPDEAAPLNLSYIYGINGKLGARILNRNPNEHFCIYALGHVASLINLNTKAVQHFQGHDAILISIEHDHKGRFIVTADKTKVIVWDIGDLGREVPMRLRTISKPFPKKITIAATGMSHCGKYIALASEKTPAGTQVKFWRWSYDQDECDGKFAISDKFGHVQSIKFSNNADENEFFVVTLKYGVVFATWDPENGKLLVYTPEQKKFGTLHQSCYVPGRRTVASVTGHGRIILWADTMLNTTKDPVTNEKNFVKMVTLQHSYPIYDIKDIDGMLATCNEIGEVRFYDTEIRLLYVYSFWKESPVIHISPVMVPKTIKLVDADDFDVQEDENVQIVYKSTCPVDYTLEKKPFLVREFYIVAKTGDVLHCNIFQKEAKSMLYRTSDSLASYDTLEYKPWVICANSDSKIFYLDYANYGIVREQHLKRYVFMSEEEGREITPYITCIRISSDGSNLAVGYSNGAVWMIDPLIIAPLTPSPIRFSKRAIRHMVFSDHPALAYEDTNATITLLHYSRDKMEWVLTGKYRHHHKPLVLLTVVETAPNKQSLIALGEERLFMEYDLDRSLRKNALEVKRNLILEQTGDFTAAAVMKLSKIVEKDTSTNGMVILVADAHYKFKIFDIVTMERLYMITGPIYDAPVRIILNFSEPHNFYSKMLLFATEKTLGCIVLPIDGNMYRYSGIIAHPKQISKLLPYGPDVFASSDGDVGGTVWSIKESNVMRYFKLGGEGLVPFCNFIPGGKEGWLFKEMQDMFYYMQIMTRGGDAPEEHLVTDFIPVEDLPDYMRAIGFFPSDYEIQCLLKEATRTTSPSIPPPTAVSFEDTVKLYLNHKPVAGYELEDIKAAVEYLADQRSSDYVTSDQVDERDEAQITLQRLYKVMTKRGEALPDETAKRYLIELLSEETGKMNIKKLDVQAEYDSLPDIFNVREFCSELLGVDIKEQPYDSLESHAGSTMDPAEVYSQLENRFSVAVPESDIDVDKECEKDEVRSLLKQGRVIKIVDDSQHL